jgi:hypothetical protein
MTIALLPGSAVAEVWKPPVHNMHDPVFLFLAVDVPEIWAGATAAKRDYLDWTEWLEFFKQAVRRGCVTVDELTGGILPEEGADERPMYWCALVRQYRRIKAAKDAGLSPWQYHAQLDAAEAAKRAKKAAKRERPGTAERAPAAQNDDEADLLAYAGERGIVEDEI